MIVRMLSLRFMLDHFWARRHLSDYLDEDLDATARARVERHTHRCPPCHALLDSLRRTLNGLRQLGATTREPGVAESVIARLRRL